MQLVVLLKLRQTRQGRRHRQRPPVVHDATGRRRNLSGHGVHQVVIFALDAWRRHQHGDVLLRVVLTRVLRALLKMLVQQRADGRSSDG